MLLLAVVTRHVVFLFYFSYSKSVSLHLVSCQRCVSGDVVKTRWKNIKVGQVVRVVDNEQFPADLLCLKTGLTDNVAFIKTTNLDGESNLKLRLPIELREIDSGLDEQQFCERVGWGRGQWATYACFT